MPIEHASHAAYDAWRARGWLRVAADGAGDGQAARAGAGAERADHITDHDSRPMRAHGYAPLQGYNVQLAVNDQQVVIAAELTTDSPDFGHLEPMVRAAQRELRAVELGDPDVVLADAGYWQQRQIEAVASDGIQVLVAPDSSPAPRRTPWMDRRPL